MHDNTPVTGRMYIGPSDPPRCPAHDGPMHDNPAMYRFECKGWDGEGCDHVVTHEDWYTCIGTYDGAGFTYRVT